MNLYFPYLVLALGIALAVAVVWGVTWGLTRLRSDLHQADRDHHASPAESYQTRMRLDLAARTKARQAQAEDQ